MSNPIMDRDAREVTENIKRGAEYLDRRAAEESRPELQTLKTEAAVGARAYAEQLQSATTAGSLTQTDIDAGRLVAHAAHMDGWLSVGGVVSERRGRHQLLQAGYFRLEPLAGETKPRYVLGTPPGPQASTGAAATSREVAQAAQLAHGHPAVSAPAPTVTAASTTPAAARAANRDHSPQIG